MTKKEVALYENYKSCIERYGLRDLMDVYSTCSVAKRKAWEEIKEDCARLNGEGLTIVSKCINNFSCAYTYRGERGEERLRYETYMNSYDFAIEERC